MGTPELRGIYIHPQNPARADLEGAGDQLSSSGVSSASGSISSNNNNDAALPRKRNVSPDADLADSQSGSLFDEYEMEKIRRLMAHVDGDRRTSGSIVSSHRGSIDPSLMSSVFICVLILIFSISVYAFASLYRAVRKRMSGS